MPTVPGVPAHWWRPDWPAPKGVSAVLTTRGTELAHGRSRGPFGFFNLGDHVQDSPQAVAANREQLARSLQAHPVFLQQVHGTQVLELQAGLEDGQVADAAVTRQPGLACTVMVADCLPVLLCDASGERVAAIHAGWRGLCAGVIERAVHALLQLPGQAPARPAEVLAWLGPCIGPRVFEVGPEVRAAFVHADPAAAACFASRGDGKYLADLPGLARQRLRGLGLSRVHGNDGSPSWCTVENPTRFYSHRRDQQRLGGSGRMAACIWRIAQDSPGEC